MYMGVPCLPETADSFSELAAAQSECHSVLTVAPGSLVMDPHKIKSPMRKSEKKPLF